MLPSSAIRLGTYGRIILMKVHAPALAIRAASSAVANPSTDQTSAVNSSSENPIQKAHDYFNSPDRDYVNFPNPVQPMHPPPVRLGFVPDSWFQAFYNKTGVTGPYIFGFGLVATLLSKEIWVIDHGFTEVICFTTALTILIKKIGPSVAEYMDKIVEKREDVFFKEPIRKAKSKDEQFVAAAEQVIAAQDGQEFLFAAKKENVDLQLESIYRKRLIEAHQAVKKRLDHQLDTQNAKIKFQQEHMVKWIVDNVVKGITPQQEQDSIKKCLADLKIMQTAVRA